MTEGRKKRRKPWDRRKHPAIRAHMEIAKKHDLKGHLKMAYEIFWGSGGSWEKAEQWFEQPKVKAQGDSWNVVRDVMRDNRQRLDELYAETLALFRYYSDQSTATH